MDLTTLLDCCAAVYQGATIVAGPEGRDGAAVYAFGKTAVLAFRGTLTSGRGTALDWINDCDAEPVRDPGFPGRVHEGFLRSLNDLWDGVDRAIKDTAFVDLVITGHSKGGALAVLAGQRLAYLSPRVFTFAAPMCGDAAFAAKLAFHGVRFENPKDIVPRLPPVGYRPAGELIGPPPEWTAPKGFVLNHELATGYRPWITETITPEAA